MATPIFTTITRVSVVEKEVLGLSSLLNTPMVSLTNTQTATLTFTMVASPPHLLSPARTLCTTVLNTRFS